MSQTERVFDILYQLSRENGKVKLKDIAERYEVSTRQIARDIEYIRYRIMPDDNMIVFDRKIMAYRLVDGVDILSGWREGMIVSMSAMSAMTGNLIGNNEIENALPLSMRKILSHVDYRTPVRGYGDDEKWLSLIFETFENSSALIIRYRKTPDSAAEDRFVDPLKLVNYQGAWYLLGYDREKKAMRTFRLSRAESVLIADAPSEEHNAEEVQLLLDSSYGIFIGSETWYTMMFCGDAAVRVSAELWHDEQKGRWIGEKYELSVPAGGFIELRSRLLSYGKEAYPVAPHDFVDSYWNEVAQMQKNGQQKYRR